MNETPINRNVLNYYCFDCVFSAQGDGAYFEYRHDKNLKIHSHDYEHFDVTFEDKITILKCRVKYIHQLKIVCLKFTGEELINN